MAGSDGSVRCTIPAGRKDGKKVKGSAFDMIIGIGERPGEEFAALNVLHQVERGKPLERLLAPEFRGVWLDLDKRFNEMQKGEQARTASKQARKEAVERRAKFEKLKESGTINISAASRQMIEDALIENQAAKGSAHEATLVATDNTERLQSKEALGLKKQLLEMGFSELDAIHASQIFRTVTDALDYLCLNLDESELPPSLAPKSDIEVVRFKASKDGIGIRDFDPNTRDKLASLVCLSQRAAERVLRVSGVNLINAAAELYNVLTQNVVASHMFPAFGDVKRLKTLTATGAEERSIECETLTAIYGDDATKFGVGVLPMFPERWCALIRLDEGAAGIRSKGPISVALVDVDGLYPYSAPLVLVHSNFGGLLSKEDALSPAQRRLLMRAVGGEVAKLRQGQDTDKLLHEDDVVPIPLGHAVLSFLSNASTSDLLSSAARLPNRIKASGANGTEADSTVRVVKPSSGYAKKHQLSRHISSPQTAPPLKSTPALEGMRKKRRSLPAYNSRNDIITSVTANQVTVVSGATGSGKTTQVPQFLLEQASKNQAPVSIICTQPRRIAAMSVAERVSSERCEKVGGVVGYQVKLNSKVSSRTRLIFCTTGVLLRRLQSDPNLESLTHVVVDEVHERSVETDFLLLLLREILTRRPTLRVVLMSATLDAQKFSRYFETALAGANSAVPIVSIPGRTFPVHELYLADAVELAEYQLRPGDRYAKKASTITHHGKYGPQPTQSDLSRARHMSAGQMASMHEGAATDIRNEVSQPAVNKTLPSRANTTAPITFRDGIGSAPHVKDTVSLIDESMVNIDLIALLVKRIDADGRRKEEKGAVLIFLPGAAEISSTIQRLSTGEGASTLWPLPLHSLLSPQDQSRVFQKAPKGKRKVICATNIAETSITVDDVTVVIDTMRAKEMSYDSMNGSSVLRECFISKAAAKQRAGRAGRVSSGTCYRLVRQQMFDDRIAAQQIPEIKRVSLEHLVLNIVSIVPQQQYNNNPQSFLASAIDPPDPQAVKRAVTNLVDIGALESTGRSNDSAVRMTALGRHLSGLPVDARIGKLLIYGSVFKCIDAALTVAATVSERSPFYAPFDKREEARIARQPFVWGKSDLLTFVKAFDAWREIRQSGGGYASEQEFCTKHFLSRKALQSISDGRKQLADALADAGFGPPGTAHSRGWEHDPEMNKFGKTLRVLRAVVCAALYPNVARIDVPNTVYREVAGGSVAKEFASRQLKIRAKTGERLFLHPESVNFLQGNYETRWLAYFSKVKTSKLYIRDTTMVSPYAILLFGGEIAVHHQKGQLSVDKWVVFKAPARVAVLARELRRELDALLLKKFEDVETDLSTEGGSVTDVIVKLITSES